MTLRDDGETLGLFEPLMVSEGSPDRPSLNDLALSLAERSAAFSASLPAPIAVALSDLVRSMNCYYSNLIEGHNTHPIDIERAMKNDYSTDTKKRDLQLEAKAHITVQKWIDEGGLTQEAIAPASIIEIHKRFRGCDSPMIMSSIDGLAAFNPRRVGLGSWGQERPHVDGCRESEVSLRVVKRQYDCMAQKRARCPEGARSGGCNGGAQRVPLPRWCGTTTHILRTSLMMSAGQVSAFRIRAIVESSSPGS